MAVNASRTDVQVMHIQTDCFQMFSGVQGVLTCPVLELAVTRKRAPSTRKMGWCLQHMTRHVQRH
jgi:hypothetical protein